MCRNARLTLLAACLAPAVFLGACTSSTAIVARAASEGRLRPGMTTMGECVSIVGRRPYAWEVDQVIQVTDGHGSPSVVWVVDRLPPNMGGFCLKFSGSIRGDYIPTTSGLINWGWGLGFYRTGRLANDHGMHVGSA